MDEQRSVGLYFMCAITMFFIMVCITFMSRESRLREQEMMDYYSSPLTKEQIDEAWEKFEQREEIRKALRKPTLKEKLPEYPGD